MPQGKIAIIGTGFVGAATAYSCLMRNIASELILVDVNETLCKGQALDLSDALSFSDTPYIKVGSYADAAQADIIIITAGQAQIPGQSRTELLATNKTIISDICTKLTLLNKNAVIVMVTNPVDIMTRLAQKLLDLPMQQVIGSGTMLDSQRLRNLIAQKIQVAEQSIHAYVIGEHGDSQVAALSCARIAGVPLTQFIPLQELEKLARKAQQKVYEILTYKKYTNYGVASCVAALCQNILFDNNRIIPVSCYLKQYDLCMSMPTTIGKGGAQQIITVPLSPNELDRLQASAQTIRENLQLII